MSDTTLAKSYNPVEIEAFWGPEWEKKGYFTPDLQHNAPSFSVLLPPPNVTGTLHLGHAFNTTIIDSLVRYHRMLGEKTAWIPGTDHAGIATQIVVERQLEAQQLSRHDLGREKFIEKIWEWKQQSGNQITQQIRQLGHSIDWTKEYFTLNDTMSEAVREVFITLYQQGLIYRGKRLVNWDPVLKTAVSDLEVNSQEEQGFLWHIRYPLSDGAGHLTIATTRPETLFADVALMVHPEDTRYQTFIGKSVHLPLTNREIPVIADDYVDPEFGTGVVKVSPAHDFNDYQVAQRHQLDLIEIFTLDVHCNENVPEAYRGLDRDAARKQVIQDLTQHHFLEKTVPHQLMVPRGDRSGAILEPMLTNQWFVAMSKASPAGTHFPGKSIAQVAIDAAKNEEITFFPENWRNIYFQWLENIQDWCISRQLWWGHQIPAWHGENGQIFVAKTIEDAQKQALEQGYHGTLTQDADVLDTWFSSALVPFSSLGWPKQTAELEAFLPSSVLVTGFDIIFFWVARMVMMTLHFTGKIPFKAVYIHNLVRDAEGQKMSKSKGNTIDPIDIIHGIDLAHLIEKRTFGLMNPKQAQVIEKKTRKDFPLGIPAYGTDALRFTMTSIASFGNLNFDLARCEGYRNFCNKLWNASRFVLMHCEDYQFHESTTIEYTHADQWILAQLDQTIDQVRTHFTSYRLDLVAQTLYKFIWEEYCDWYLELAKVNLNSQHAAQKYSAQTTLLYVLDHILRLIHPIMPYITEALWQKIAPLSPASKQVQTIMLQPYPQSTHASFNETALQWGEQLKKLTDTCRNLRGKMNLSPALKIPLLATSENLSLSDFAPYIQLLARLSEVNVLDAKQFTIAQKNNAPVIIIDQTQLSLAVEIDLQAEKERLTKEINRVKDEVNKCQQKLNNPNFVNRAPQKIVNQEKERLTNFENLFSQLNIQLGKITEQK